MKSTKVRLFILFSLTIFTACFLSCEEEPVLEFDEKTFYKEWAAWEALGIKDYSVKRKYELHSPSKRSSYILAIVKDNKNYEILPLDGRDNINFSDTPPVITATYNWIRSLYESHKEDHGSIRISYNMDFHYPEIINIELPRKANPKELGKGACYLSEFTPLTLETEEK